MVLDSTLSENTFTYEQSTGYIIEEDFSKIPEILERLAQKRVIADSKEEIKRHKKELDYSKNYVRLLEEIEKKKRMATELKNDEDKKRQEVERRKTVENRNAVIKLSVTSDKL